MRTLLCLALALLALPASAATCKISEYRALATDPGGKEIQVALEPPVTTQTVTYSTSNQSAAFNSATRFIRVVCDAKAHYVVSVAGTNATASSPFLPADSPEYFGVQANFSYVIDFYDGSS